MEAPQSPAKLYPICGAGFCIISLYTESPDCIGCFGKGVFLCFKTEYVGIKPHKRGESCFSVVKGSADLVPIKTLVKGKSQFFCLDSACAVPIDNEVPCIFNILGFTFYFKNSHHMHCCATLAKIEEHHFSMFGGERRGILV